MVSEKLLPAMSALRTALAFAVNEYQTVRGEKLQNCGSPGSVVAWVLSTESLNGNRRISLARLKSSFAGGRATGDLKVVDNAGIASVDAVDTLGDMRAMPA